MISHTEVEITMSTLILDTETHDLNGYPIEIAYAPCSFEQGVKLMDYVKKRRFELEKQESEVSS